MPGPLMSDLDAPDGWVAKRYQSTEPGPDYTCPRCHRPVARRREHVVAWPGEEGRTEAVHRHWHTGCWKAAVREGIDRYRWG